MRFISPIAHFSMTLITCMLITGISCNPLQQDIIVYPPGTGSPEDARTTPQSPIQQAPSASDDTIERNITVTEANSIFSIGLPPGYMEEREVNAQEPVDFWFEYLTPGISLKVNGADIEIPADRRNSKLGYMGNVTSFKYIMKNLTGQTVSYNLHIIPSKSGESVPVVTREKWIAPQ